MALGRKKPRVRLIEDSAFLIQRHKPHEEKERPQFRSDKHKAWVRSLPCCAVHSPAHEGLVQAAHYRIGTDGGGGLEPSDFFVNPLCERCHLRVQHRIGERSFHRLFTQYEDPAREALSLALKSPCQKTRIAAQEEWERRGYA
jgi:hypothetical protein